MYWLPHCALPLARSRLAGLLSRYAGYSTFWMYGLPGCQYVGFATYSMLLAPQVPTLNGPVPTGDSSAQVSGALAASPVLKMCLGAIVTWLAKLKKYGVA